MGADKVESESLGEAFPKELARVREVLGAYKQIGMPGMFGAAMIEGLLRVADQAVIEGDLPKMISVYKELKQVE